MIPGLLLGLWSFRIAIRISAVRKPRPPPRRHRPWKDYRTLLQTPSYVLDTLGMAAMTFAIGGNCLLDAQLPGVAHVRADLGAGRARFFGNHGRGRYPGRPDRRMAGDACRPRFPGSYFLVSGAAMLLRPLHPADPGLPFPAAWVFVFVAEFLLFFNTGPTNTILANVVHPSIRSTGFAVNILIIHMLGDAISPPLIGAVAIASTASAWDSSRSRCSSSSAASFGSSGAQHWKPTPPPPRNVHSIVMPLVPDP